ncbi:hypothetical protein D9M72_498750 [compost metagenome]
MAGEVAGRVERQFGPKRRMDDRNRVVVDQPFADQAVIPAEPMPDGDVDAVTVKIRQPVRGADADVDARHLLFEGADARHQPLRGEGRRAAHRQHRRTFARRQLLGCLPHHAEGTSERCEIEAAVFRQNQLPGPSFEERYTQRLLQLPHLQADGARRDVEFVRGLGDA